ncbi:MAG: hypothetical protein QNJ97_25375 [Myxococcota bacterium]|nr:hypothetical protein [Myxococcota bacterium]
MNRLKPDTTAPRSFVQLLVMAEILARRNNIGPLARLWVPLGRSRRSTSKGQQPSSTDTQEK